MGDPENESREAPCATALGRVADPRALDGLAAGCARLRVRVERAAFVSGAWVELRAPRRLRCARCDGGGCDGCGRSGVLRGPDDEEERRLTVELPAGRSASLVCLRVPAPFGSGDVSLLFVEIEPGDTTMEGVVVSPLGARGDGAPLPAGSTLRSEEGWLGPSSAVVFTAVLALAAGLAWALAR